MTGPLQFLIASAAVAGAFVAGSALTRDRTHAGTGRAVLYYEDPMHPRYRSPKPGIAPDCGMQLRPVYAAEPESSNEVKVTREQREHLGIQTVTVRRLESAASLRAQGEVMLDEAAVSPVFANVEGTIRSVYPVTTGSLVSKGQPLVSIYSRDLQVAERAYVFALDNLENVRRTGAAPRPEQNQSTIDESRLNLLNLGLDERQVEAIGRQRKPELLADLTSRIDGVVLMRKAFPGQKFDRGMELFRIADLSRVWINVELFGCGTNAPAPGDRASIAPIPGGEKIAARVSAAIPQFDGAAGVCRMRLEAQNANHRLRPEMVVSVEFPGRPHPALVVPREAVLDTGAGKLVYLLREGDRFERHEVDAFPLSPDLMEITRGLAAGDRVASSGVFLLDSETQLTHPRARM